MMWKKARKKLMILVGRTREGSENRASSEEGSHHSNTNGDLNKADNVLEKQVSTSLSDVVDQKKLIIYFS